LPPSVWQGMPGRATDVAILSLVGQQHSWHPWSMTPQRTFASLMSMLPPLAILVLAAGLDRRARWWMLLVVAATSLIGLVIGVAARGSGWSGLFIYSDMTSSGITGFQSSHNGEADIMLFGMMSYVAVCLEWFAARPRPFASWQIGCATLSGMIVYVLGVFFTSSRMGILLLVPAGFACLLMLWRSALVHRGAVLAIAGGGAIVTAVAAFALRNDAAVIAIVSRFGAGDPARETMWRQSIAVAKGLYPFGAGIGSFIPLFMRCEALETVTDTYVIRAHNDFIELLVEAGVLGAAVLVAVCVILVISLVRNMKRQEGVFGTQGIFAVFVLLLIALHSLVDYPLRSMSIASVAALALSILLASPKGEWSARRLKG